MEKLYLKATLKVIGGPSIDVSHEFSSNAYHVIEVEIPAAAASAPPKVVVVEGGEVNHIDLLLLRLKDGSKYTADKLCYSVNAPIDTTHPKILFDAPQILMGQGAVGLLKGTLNTLHTLHFSNTGNDSVAVQIFVGRQALSS